MPSGGQCVSQPSAALLEVDGVHPQRKCHEKEEGRKTSCMRAITISSYVRKTGSAYL